MSITMCTMRTKLSQLQDLMEREKMMIDDMLNSHLSNIRIIIIIHIKMVINGH